MYNQTALAALTTSFNAVDENIKIEAARALAKLSGKYSSDILKLFNKSNTLEKPGLAWALTKSKSLTLEELISSLSDDESRQWITYMIGVQGSSRHISEIEKLRRVDPEVYFAVTVLWKIMTSWIYNLKEY